MSARALPTKLVAPHERPAPDATGLPNNSLHLFDRSNRTNPTLVPLEGHGPQGVEHGFCVLPFLGGLVLLRVLAGLAGTAWAGSFSRRS